MSNAQRTSINWLFRHESYLMKVAQLESYLIKVVQLRVPDMNSRAGLTLSRATR